eukprot:maker-scaffold464_size163657-snap-gene-0.29 protein:Tk05270 transcript:maker-scaffold464_size163657-snap-gene-0.29-mRNA-1 annotation:"hypothetical protein TcasGA2_TC001761"
MALVGSVPNDNVFQAGQACKVLAMWGRGRDAVAKVLSGSGRMVSTAFQRTNISLSGPKAVVGGLTAAGFAYAAYSYHDLSSNPGPQSPDQPLQGRDVIKVDEMFMTTKLKIPIKPGEARFRAFASIEIDGEPFMTPRDFLDAMIQERPKPRIKSKLVPPENLTAILDSTPGIQTCVNLLNSEDPFLLRRLGERGIFSFVEYLFLLSILTRPTSGFRTAFDLIDVSQEDSILKSEFHQFCLMSSSLQKKSQTSTLVDLTSGPQDTSLIRLFFGPNGDHKLGFDEFSAFLAGLQREVLRTEFLEYSRGLEKITARDFAQLLLRYTTLTDENQEHYYAMLSDRLPRCKDHPILTFSEVERFFLLVNNINDFQYAFLLYPQIGRKLSQDEFHRAAKISLDGQELSQEVVEIIFALFDRAGE